MRHCSNHINDIINDSGCLKASFRNSATKMVVTVVHNDTDSIKHQVRLLREGLANVTPSVDFKSCCVWEFTDNVFEENQTVLVILSKQCQSFHKNILESLQKYDKRCSEVKCRVCVVFEVEGGTIDEDFESVIGKENFVVVKDLRHSVKWLPKVCAFLFKTKGENKAIKCIIPKVGTNSEVKEFRSGLMENLRNLGLNVSEEFKASSPRCCVLFRKDEEYDLDESVNNISSEKKDIEMSGGTIFEYRASYTDKPRMLSSNEITYGRESMVLFIIHMLYVMEKINVTTMLGQRLRRIKKSSETTKTCKCCEPCCCELDCSCWITPVELDIPACQKALLYVFLLLFNPSALLYFCTPFAYIYLSLGFKFWRYSILVWMVLCSLAMYGFSIYLLITQEVCVTNLYACIFGSIFAIGASITSLYFQWKYFSGIEHVE